MKSILRAGGRWLAACGASMALLLGGCGGGGSAGSPVLGGGGSTGTDTSGRVTVTLSSSTVSLDKPATVTVLVKDSNGALQAGQVVKFSTTQNLALFSAPSALTNDKGVATVTVAPLAADTSGADTVVATITSGTATFSSSVGFQLKPTALPVASLTLSLSSATVTAASPATVTAVLKDSAGTPLPGQVVTFATEGTIGKLNAPSGLTNAAGSTSVTLSPATASTTGADKVTASITINGKTLVSSQGFQLTATDVSITSFSSDVANLSVYGQSQLSVSLAGTSSTTPVSLNVSSQCVNIGRATLTPSTTSTTTGQASFTYRDQGCGSYQTVDNLQITIAGTATTRSLQLGLAQPQASSITFVSSSPQSIYLKGTGNVESSTVVFQVKDGANNGVPNQLVDFEPTTLAGGLTLDGGSTKVTKKTDGSGFAQVRINAGTVPTPVRVKATLNGSTISTSSNNLAIAVGLPTQTRFSISAKTLNIEGFDRDGTPDEFTVIAADRLGNPVPDGTSINYVSEAGQIEAIKMTGLVNGIAQAKANYVSNGQRPPDGRVTILAWVLGEESFLDRNGNNVYDLGEDFQDLGDLYLDRLFNGAYDFNKDQFVSQSLGGSQNCLEAQDPLLQLYDSFGRQNPAYPSKPGSCDGVWGKAYVRQAMQIVWSTSSARPSWGAGLPPGVYDDGAGCPAKRSMIYDYDVNGQPLKGTIWDVVGSRVYANAGSGALSFVVADANDLAFNPMAAGTVVSAVGTDGLSVSIAGGSPVPSSTLPTNAVVNFKFDDKTTSGTITLGFQSPSGLTTAVPFFISRKAAPDAGTLCQ